MSAPKTRYIQASPLEMRLRELFADLTEPLTVKQLAARMGVVPETMQTKLGHLVAEGTLERRKSWDCGRPYKYLLAGKPWPDWTTAQIAYKALSDARYRKDVRVAIAATRPEVTP